MNSSDCRFSESTTQAKVSAFYRLDLRSRLTPKMVQLPSTRKCMEQTHSGEYTSVPPSTSTYGVLLFTNHFPAWCACRPTAHATFERLSNTPLRRHTDSTPCERSPSLLPSPSLALMCTTLYPALYRCRPIRSAVLRFPELGLRFASTATDIATSVGLPRTSDWVALEPVADDEGVDIDMMLLSTRGR